MKLKQIKEFNGDQFLKDIKTSRGILILAQTSKIFLSVTKKDVLKNAEENKINYYMTDEIYIRKRMVMVII